MHGHELSSNQIAIAVSSPFCGFPMVDSSGEEFLEKLAVGRHVLSKAGRGYVVKK